MRLLRLRRPLNLPRSSVRRRRNPLAEFSICLYTSADREGKDVLHEKPVENIYFVCFVALFRSRDLFVTSAGIDCESHPNPIRLYILRIWTYYVSFAKFGIATPPSGGRGFKARILRYLYPSSTGWCITMGSTDSCMMVRRPCVLRNNCLAFAQTMQQLYKPTNNCVNPSTIVPTMQLGNYLWSIAPPSVFLSFLAE